MRQQTQQNRRNNGRSRSNRKTQNPLTRNYESNGPDVKIRGTASHIAEKYTSLARDALSSGDTVNAENLFQHAEHYNRIIMSAQQSDQASSNDNAVTDNANGQPNEALENGDLEDTQKQGTADGERRQEKQGRSNRSRNGKGNSSSNNRRRRRRPNGNGSEAKNSESMNGAPKDNKNGEAKNVESKNGTEQKAEPVKSDIPAPPPETKSEPTTEAPPDGALI